MSKTGLIVEGGGMKCAYSAGVLDRLMENGITFDYCIGVSAGSANVASFMAGQIGRNRRFYTEHIHDPMYFGLKSFRKTGNLFNLGFIYGELTNSDGPDPLDYDAIMANPAEYKIVATCAETGEPVYFTKKDLIKDDYRHIMASCAIPAACKPVEIDGKHYYDGGISDSIPIQKALDDGCERVVAILSKKHDFVKTPEKHKFLYTHMCRKYPKAIEDMDNRHIMYKKCQDTLFGMEDRGGAFVFAPTNPPKMSTYTMDEKINQQLYDLGVSDYNNRQEEFIQFMKESQA